MHGDKKLGKLYHNYTKMYFLMQRKSEFTGCFWQHYICFTLNAHFDAQHETAKPIRNSSTPIMARL